MKISTGTFDRRYKIPGDRQFQHLFQYLFFFLCFILLIWQAVVTSFLSS